VVVRNIRRPESIVMQGLAGAGVATIHEAMGRTGLLDPAVTARQHGLTIAGPAVTVLCQAGDNLMIHAAVEQCRPGDVLVVSTTSRSTDGMFGELLATSLRSRGVAGLVIDAGVRDLRELRELGFGVWSRAISAQGTVKATAGSVNVPVICAGRLVQPGDAVVADDDGVVVVPREQAPAALADANARLAKENDKRRELAGGVLGLDLYGLRPLLDQLGVVYLEEQP
jgi:4-hydroxy-4-methyl-2-oxoglutarate aldolase